MSTETRRTLIAARAHPDAPNGGTEGLAGEPQDVKEARNQFLLSMKKYCHEAIDDLATLSESTNDPELMEWGQRWSIKYPWVLDRATAILENWREDSDALDERRLSYVAGGPASLDVNITLPRAEPIRETRQEARTRLQTEARAAIDEHLDRRYGPNRQRPLELERNANWTVRHVLRGESHERIARSAAEPDPIGAGKVKVKQAIDRYRRFIELGEGDVDS